ncbi:MAG TPA: hypothetical protein DCM68_00830 [Verrucomicrobia bacterium]|nr:hypothetical protein [Verrucomicrobiota bacterium]
MLALCAANLLAQHAATGGARAARAAAGGLLLGLACSVRETSVLLLAPFAGYAFWSWRADPRIRFWRDAGLFSAGFAAGIAPLMLQGLLATGQALLPPQASVENNLVPGVHFTWTCLRGTVKHAWPYFQRMAGPGLLLLAWSAALGLWRRNRIVAGLLLPAALVHAVFYSFYWTFVPRYFYSVVVFAVPVAAWGLLATLHGAVARMPPRIRAAVPAFAVGAAALAAAIHLWSIRPDAPRFQIPQARRFAADLGQAWPADSLVFCRRNLCEMVRWFTPADSFPATALIPKNAPAQTGLREALAPHFAGSRPLFLLEMNSGSGREVDAALLERLCGLDPVREFPADAYHLGGRTGADVFRLFRVRSWSPSSLALPGVKQARQGFARFDFALNAVPIATPVLAGDFVPSTLERNTPRIQGPATVSLPGPVQTGEAATAELRLRGATRASRALEIEVSIGASFRTLRLPQDRAWHLFTLSAEGPLEKPALEFRSAAPFDLHRVDWGIPQPTNRLEIDIGAEGDFVHLREGWFGRESAAAGNGRWTGPTATLAWRSDAPGATGRVAMRHLAQNLPAGASPPRLWLNEVELSAAPVPNAGPDEANLAAEFPAGLLRTDNLFRIESHGWQPGGSDSRTLGVMVDWILLEANPLDAPPGAP